ncbi:MAG: hypothetical protein JXA93_00610 [Anaerolineae bacterium]|nr:hypothetical protein [Anaerolineae bacterium]
MSEVTWGTATATLAAPFVFLLPGWALLKLLLPWESLSPDSRPDVASQMVLAAGLTVTLTPVAILALYLLGLQIGSASVLAVLALCAAVAVWHGTVTWRDARQRGVSWREQLAWVDAPLIILAALTIVVVVTRLWPVRGINYGLWGDSYQHTMVVQLILDRGGLFQSWAPYAPLRTFSYHFGFHSTVALFQWATGWLTGDATPRAVVLVGQYLNVMAVLSLYPLATRLGKSRWVGILAVFITGLLMPMPAFYVNWGRYTQLAAQVVLPIALWLMMEALDEGQTGVRQWLLAGLAVGGLALTHYRVATFLPSFLLPYLVWHALRRQTRARRLALGLVASGGVSILVLTPWLWHLACSVYPAIAANLLNQPNAGETLNQAFLYADLAQWVPLPLAALAVVAAALALARRSAMSLVGAWTIMLLLLANPHWLGLPGTGLVDNFLVVLGLYMPVSMLVGYLGVEAAKLAARRSRVVLAAAAVLIVILGVGGARTQAQVLKPEFQIMTEADAAAMRWIQANTPPDARFLVNGFLAFSDHYVVGSDGGWWIPLLAQRENTIPPLLYTTEAAVEPEYIEDVKTFTSYVTSASLDDPATVEWLSSQGITHVYVGAQGGRVNDPDTPLLDAQVMQSSAYYRTIYHENDVWIFILSP